MNFTELVTRSRKEGQTVYDKRLLSIDPGHTTGYAVFQGCTLFQCGEIETKPDQDQLTLVNLTKLFTEHQPNEVVFEDYRIYKWRAQHHANSEVHTVRIVGVIMTLCMQHGLEYFKQMASVGKAFATDAKLEEWGFYQPGMKHARDAIRHACYFIAIGEPQHKKNRPTMSVG